MELGSGAFRCRANPVSLEGARTSFFSPEFSQLYLAVRRTFLWPRILGEASMQTLRKILEQAETNRVAVGHFNVSDLVTLKAVFEAAGHLELPVIVGVSEGERRFMGVRQVSALVKSLREAYDFPIFLNADHTHSLPSAMEAAREGFDWIVFDVSTLPFEENVRQTKAAVEALKALRPDILVEGEIGDIGSGSEIHDAVPDLQKGLTSPAKPNSS
jgi:fructose-bisphosphate aldolase class II